MTELKFKYYYKRQNGSIIHSFYTIEEIEEGNFYGEIVARCLYTGCKDVDGKEIYEGDRIRYGDTNDNVVFSVEYDKGTFIVYDDDKDFSLNLNHLKPIKIIGNIYEDGV